VDAVQWYFGTDTNQAVPFPECGDATHFYLGRLGGATCPGGGGLGQAALKRLPAHHCFGYWDLASPAGANATESFSSWGQRQAEAFYHTWLSTNVTEMIKGATLFLDVEAGNGGLGGGSATDKSFNQDVLYGALEVLNHTERHTTAGLYISEDTWDAYFG